MLQILRNKAQSIVIQAIVVIIAIVFIFWGVGSNLLNNNEAALVINDEEISFEDFQVAYDRAYNNLRNQFGGNVPQGLLENLGIKQQVINQLTQEALLRQGAAQMGILISREEIQDTIQNMVQFQDNGSFSIEKYNTLLAANNYSPTKFEETVKLDMLSQKVRLSIGDFAATATEYEIADLYKLDKSSVSFKYVKISPAEFTDVIPATDEDISAWYVTVQENYKTDPEVKLKYLDFSYTTVGEKITIDDSTLEQYYQDNLAEFTQAEKRGARHILFKVDENSSPEVAEKQMQKANEILELAKSGSDFAELAKQYSEGPSNTQGGDLGMFTRGQMVKPFEDAVFSLEVDQISEVVKTSFGYHIIKLEKISPAVATPFSDVKDSILAKLQTEEAKPLAFQVANEAYEGIIGAGSLDGYLQAHPEAPVRITDFFSRNTPPANIGNDQKFLNTAFSLKAQELSSLIETSQGYAVLFAEAVKEPVVPALDAVKDRVTQDYQQFKTKESADNAAKSLLQKAKADNSIASAAEQGGFSVEESGFHTKGDSQNADIPPTVIETAFTLSGKQPFPEEVVEGNDALYIIEFSELKDPESDLTEEDRERYRGAIIQMKQQQILSSWLKNRREQSEIFSHKSL